MAIDWNAVSAVGQWAGALATFAAVIVSLRLARQGELPGLKPVCVLAVKKEGERAFDYVSVSVSNTGVRPEKIASLAWGFGSPRTIKLLLVPSKVSSLDGLPKVIAPGETADFGLLANDFMKRAQSVRDWSRQERFLGVALRPIYIIVNTATGMSRRARVTPGVQALLRTGDPALFLGDDDLAQRLRDGMVYSRVDTKRRRGRSVEEG